MRAYAARAFLDRLAGMVAAVRDAGFGEHASLRERVAAAEAAARSEAEALRERATAETAAADHALHSTPGQREGMAPLSCGRDSFAALQARLGRLNRGMYAGTKLNDGEIQIQIQNILVTQVKPATSC